MGKRHADRAAPMVADLSARYLEEHAVRKVERAQMDDRAMLNKIVLPAIGRLKVHEVKEMKAPVTASMLYAWHYLQNNRPCSIYYYSKYERTIYRKLQEKYEDICTRDEIEELFDPSDAVDLYNDVVKKATEWPTRDFSIKTLAKFLGFAWRDTHPSGAASIEWFDRWVKTGDKAIQRRILAYNEDDCIATRVLLDGIRSL